MANELDRRYYFEALLNQKRNIQASGGNLVNPSLDQASISTSFENQTGLPKPNTNVNKSNDVLANIFGFADEIVAKFGAGFVNGWEGLLDLGAIGIGALGNGTGWYDGSTFTKWAQQDMGSDWAEWTKGTFGLGSIYNGIKNGNLFSADRWKQAGEGFLDLSKSTFFHQNQEARDYREYANQYYGDTDELKGTIPEFLGGAAHSIGMILPAIMTAGGVGSAVSKSGGVASGITRSGATQLSTTMGRDIATKVSLAVLGTGAAGKGAEQALNEGADSGKALAFGVASGSAEALSEMVVGGFLEKIGLGVNKVAGIFGKKTTKSAVEAFSTKGIVKELFKTMNEEGAEELSTAMLEPVLKSIYQGKEALYDKNGKLYLTSPDFWIGTDSGFNESALGQYLSGAFVGGLTGGLSTYKTLKGANKTAVQAINNKQKLNDINYELEKIKSRPNFDKNNAQYQKLNKQYAEVFLEYSKQIVEMSKNQTALKEFVSMVNNPNEYMKMVGITEQDVVSKYVKDHLSMYESPDKLSFINSANELKEMFGVDYDIVIGDAEGDEALINKNTKQIIIDESVLDHAGSEFAHEYLIHALWNTLSRGDQIKLFNEVAKDNELYEKTKDQYLDEEGKARNKSSGGDYFRQEAVAKYFQKMFKANNSVREMALIKMAFNNKSLLDKMRAVFDKQLRNIKSNEAFKIWSKSIENFYNNITTGLGSKILDAVFSGKITKEVKQYEGFIEEMRDAQFASKDVKYTKKDYNNYGWARANDVLTAGENSYIRSEIANIDKLNSQYLKTANGEFMIPINNKIVFTNGKMTNTKITQVIEILDYEQGSNIYDLEEDIYGSKRKEIDISKENRRTFKRHILEDYPYENYGKSRENNRYSSKLNERERNIGKTIQDLADSTDTNIYKSKKDSKNKITGEYYTKEGSLVSISAVRDGYVSNSVNALLDNKKFANVEEVNKFLKSQGAKVNDTKVPKITVADKTKYYYYKGNGEYGKLTIHKTGEKEIKVGKETKTVPLFDITINMADGSVKHLAENSTKPQIKKFIKSYANYDKSLDKLKARIASSEARLKAVESNKLSVEENVAKDNNTKKVKKTEPTEKKVATKNATLGDAKLIDKVSRKISNTISKSLSIDEANVSLYGNTKDITNALTTAKTIDEAVDKVLNVLTNSSYTIEDETGINSKLNVFENTDDLKSEVKSLIENSLDPTKVEELKNAKDVLEKKLRTRANEMKARISRVKQINKAKKSLLKTIRSNLKWTDDNISYHTVSLLSNLYTLLDSSELGYTAHADFIAELDAQLENYTKDKIDGKSFVPYNPAYREILEKIKSELPSAKVIEKADGSESLRYPSLDSKVLKTIQDGINLLKTMSDKAVKNRNEIYRPVAIETASKVKNLAALNKGIVNVFTKFFEGISSKYSVIKWYLGNSSLARMATTELNRRMSDRDLYVGNALLKQKEFIDSKKGLEKELTKKVSVRGQQITNDELAYLWLSLNTQANFDAINKSGVGLFERKHKTLKEVAKAGEAETLKAEVDNLISDDVKEYAQWLKNELNGTIKKDYVEWYKDRYGVEPNEIEDYWTLIRLSTEVSNIEKMLRSINLFDRAESRTNNNRMVGIVSAKGIFDSYVAQLGAEKYVKPLYHDIISIMNDADLSKELARTLGKEKVDYIKNTLDEAAGKKFDRDEGFGANILRIVTSGYTLKNLSFNLGTIAKQPLSIFTSNLPIYKTAKGFMRRVFGDSKFKKEFATLRDNIGAVKYRSGYIEAETNTDTLYKVQTPARVLMGGVTASDKFTIQDLGLATVMTIAQERNLQIGKKAFREYVYEHYNDFILTQIGNNALNRNGISQSGIARWVVGFFQGANRAAVGSFIDKIVTFTTNVNVNKNSLTDDRAKFKKDVSAKKSVLNNRTKAHEELVSKLIDAGVSMRDIVQTGEFVKSAERVEIAQNNLVEANAKLEGVNNSLKNYTQYEDMGGKMIPLNAAAGFLVQGIFVTLINEIVKHLKGKKDWDEWFGKETGWEVLFNTTVGWIPVINVVANYFANGYDIEVAGGQVITDLLETAKLVIDAIGGKESSQAKIISSVASIISNITGLPLETAYNYCVGAVNLFDKDKALEMRSLIYASSYQSTLKKYKEDGYKPKYLNALLNNYKVRNTPVIVKNEIGRLYKKGFDVMPKNFVSSYTENGETIDLTTSQIGAFRDFYDMSNKAQQTMLSSAPYKQLTDEEKARAIKYLYDAYYEASKGIITDSTNDMNKFTQLIYLSKGRFNASKFSADLCVASKLAAKGNKTRKEIVVQYVNRLRGYTKQEKLVLMYLLGYSTTDSNNKSLVNYLTSNGISLKEAKELVY